MSREGAYIFNVGTQNTGKSTELRKLIAVNKRNIIIPPSRYESAWDDVEELDWRPIFEKSTGANSIDAALIFTRPGETKNRARFMYHLGVALHELQGNAKLYIDKDTRFIFEIIANNDYGLKDAGLVSDDFKNYIPKNNLPGYVLNLVTNRRARRLDLFFACHSLRHIAQDFYDLNPSIILHRTMGDLKKVDNMSDSLRSYIAPIKERVDRISIAGFNAADAEKRCYSEVISAHDIAQYSE